MGKEILTFGDVETDKNKFHHQYTHICLGYLNIEKVLMSKKISFGRKSVSTLLVPSMMLIMLNH